MKKRRFRWYNNIDRSFCAVEEKQGSRLSRILDYPAHRDMQVYVRDLTRFYAAEPAFYDGDDSESSFRRVALDDAVQNVFAFERISARGERVLCVFNLSPATRAGYRIGVPEKGVYKAVSDSERARRTAVVMAPSASPRQRERVTGRRIT